MDLVSKFDSVQVTSDGRISERDKDVCAAHQAAYNAAKSALEELKCIWLDILAQQEKALENTGASATTYISSSGLDITVDHIEKHIQLLHRLFIFNLVSYFNETYHVTVSSEEVKNALLPEDPDRYSCSKEDLARYDEQMQVLSLRSEQIVDQLFARLEGRGLQEQALYELKSKCYGAVRNPYSGEARYICKKDVITLSYGCNFESWMSSSHWELPDGTKNILRGIAHYETGSFSAIPQTIEPLLRYYRLENDRIEFADCKKVTQLRLFKNSRVDIRFANASAAQEFAEKYLEETVC